MSHQDRKENLLRRATPEQSREFSLCSQPAAKNSLIINKLIAKTEGEQVGTTNCVSVDKVNWTLRMSSPRHTAPWFNKPWVMTLGLESREYGRRDPSRWKRGTLYPQKLALTSLTSGGRSVGILRSRTQSAEFVCFVGSWLNRRRGEGDYLKCSSTSFEKSVRVNCGVFWKL
jgi:hypothetical protein